MFVDPQEQSFATGRTINISCTAQAFPQPQFVWYRNREVIPITGTSYPPLGFVVIITSRKRSLGQGYVFTPVCQSFCSRAALHPGPGGLHLGPGGSPSKSGGLNLGPGGSTSGS